MKMNITSGSKKDLEYAYNKVLSKADELRGLRINNEDDYNKIFKILWNLGFTDLRMLEDHRIPD